MIFHYKAAQNLVAEHYERDFDLMFRLKADQNLVVEHCEWVFTWFFSLRQLKTWLQSTMKDFGTIFPLYGGFKRGCKALWKRMCDWTYSYDNEEK